MRTTIGFPTNSDFRQRGKFGFKSHKRKTSSEMVFEFKEDASNYLGEPTLLRFQNRLMNKKNLLPPLQYITKKLVASSNRHSPAGNHMLSRSSFINLWTERPKKFRNCTRASQKLDLSTYSLKQTGTTVGIGLFPHLYDWLLQGFAPF